MVIGMCILCGNPLQEHAGKKANVGEQNDPRTVGLKLPVQQVGGHAGCLEGFHHAAVRIMSRKVCRVEVDGERIRAYSRFGRSAEFSMREVADVSRSIGWIVLYDREWKPLAKLDPGLEHLELLENYLAAYGIKL